MATTARTRRRRSASDAEVEALVAPAGDEHDRVEPATAASVACGVVAFESSYQRTPPRSPTSATRWGRPANVRERGGARRRASRRRQARWPRRRARWRRRAGSARHSSSTGDELVAAGPDAARRRPRVRRPVGGPAAEPEASPSAVGGLGARRSDHRVVGVGDRERRRRPWSRPDAGLGRVVGARATRCTSRWSRRSSSQVATAGPEAAAVARAGTTTPRPRTRRGRGRRSPRPAAPRCCRRRRPARPTPRASSVTSVVTVVLPSVPVIAEQRAVVPRRGQVELAEHRHAGRGGRAEHRVALGQPGRREHRVRRSASSSSQPSCSSGASTSSTPQLGRASAGRAAVAIAVVDERPPRRPGDQRRAPPAVPVTPRPTTRTSPVGRRRRCTSVTRALAEAEEVGVEDAEGERGAEPGEDPEADDHRGLRPARQLEVVVDRRHAEDAPAEEPEADHLQDHRHRLEHEQAADDRQQQPRVVS